MKMKCSRVFIVVIVAVAIVAWLVWPKTPHGPAPVAVSGGITLTAHSNAPVTNELHAPPRHSKNIEFPGELTDKEKQEFTNLFATKLKPVAEKWALVYSNRVPFNIADLTPGRLVSRRGWGDSRFDSYTFVMGDITFGIEIFHGDTHVNYLASKQGMGALNTMPQLTEAPDLSMPVTAQQVLDLVESDCGQRFPPNQILMMPTGQSGALMGGVDAEVGKEASNPDYREFTTTSTDVSMVIGKDGKLVTYLRTP